MATRFWVGGTGTWDASDTTHWSATDNGAGGASVPTTTDTVTFNANSGGGTVTVNTTVTVQSITMGAFTGTLDFSANDNNVTLTTSFVGNGAGTRTLNMGDGTWTISGVAGSAWDMTTTTGLTFNPNGSTILLSGTTASTMTFQSGSLTYNIVTVGPKTGGGGVTIAGSPTFATLNIQGPADIAFGTSSTNTITNFNVTGTASALVILRGTTPTINVTTAAITWATMNRITFGTSAVSPTNSFDLGGNNFNGGSLSGPSGGSSGGSFF